MVKLLQNCALAMLSVYRKQIQDIDEYALAGLHLSALESIQYFETEVTESTEEIELLNLSQKILCLGKQLRIKA